MKLGLLFSGGKDSIVLGHLSRRAFYPAKIPYPFVHIDTGHNFNETIDFRDRFIEKMQAPGDFLLDSRFFQANFTG